MRRWTCCATTRPTWSWPAEPRGSACRAGAPAWPPVIGSRPARGAAVFLLEHAATAQKRGVTPLARLLGGALRGGTPANLAATGTATIREALDDAGLAPDAIRTCLTTRQGMPFIGNQTSWRIRAADDLYGDTEGAGGALLTTCALLDPAATLPALIFTSNQDGSAAALVIGK